MVKPDGSIGQCRVAQNVRGGVLEIRDGKMVLRGEAREKGWRFVRKEHGPEAVAELNAWDAECKAVGKKNAKTRIPPPSFYLEANRKTAVEDYEPREGAARALKGKRKAEVADVKIETQAAELAKLRDEVAALKAANDSGADGAQPPGPDASTVRGKSKGKR
jgi:hypothetical protein